MAERLPAKRDVVEALRLIVVRWCEWSGTQGMFPEPQTSRLEDAIYDAGKLLGIDVLSEVDKAEKAEDTREINQGNLFG